MTTEQEATLVASSAANSRARRVLAWREDLGAVSVSDSGAITVKLKGHTVTLPEPEYWRLMEMLSEASVRVVEKSSQSTKHQENRHDRNQAPDSENLARVKVPAG